MRYKTAWCSRCNAERVRVRLKIGRRMAWGCQICREPLLGKAKFGNVPTRAADGKLKHSRKEARRADELLALYRAGEITELQPDPDDPKSRQPEFRLEVYGTQAVEALIDHLENVGMTPAQQRLVTDLRRSRQKICSYRADFTYFDKNGQFVCEDPKGYRTQVYPIKKRLMVAAHNVEIIEP